MDTYLDERWAAVTERRIGADGSFVYSVRSTGIYCRPSCPSRQARADNVAFHPTCEAAEAAGFRACKRCDPRGERDEAAVIIACCRQIDAAEEPPRLAALAEAAGYSPAHFHRLFKAQTGMTPRQYAAFRRAERLRATLPATASVTEAFYDAGYNASSRFYAEAGAILGMKPATARRKGAGEAIRYATAPTRLGTVLVAMTEAGICHIALGDTAAPLIDELRDRFAQAQLTETAAITDTLVQVVALIEHQGVAADLPLDIRGTAFQQRVWQALRSIPPGSTTSYTSIAAAIGAPGATRAVASACAANQLAVVIPCHRVVRGDGGLAGYRWGVGRKVRLLALEEGQQARLKNG